MRRSITELPGQVIPAADEISGPQATHRPSGAAAISDDEVLRVVREDAWEQPRSLQAPAPEARELAVGDRVIIRQGRRSIPSLVNQLGTVVEIFRAPRDSCLVRIDSDRQRQREWFCYHDEIALYHK